MNHGPTKPTFPPLSLRDPVAGGNTYCGPAVVSALTGVTGAEAAKVMRHLSGRVNIKGCPDWLLSRTLREFGIDTRDVWHAGPPRVGPLRGGTTLAGWLKRTPRPAGKVFLISAGHHWQLVSGRRYVCGRVGEVCSVRDPRVKRRARVRGAWELFRFAPARKPACLTDAAARPVVRLARECRALARELGCEITYDARLKLHWVYGPEPVYETGGRDDPRDGNHACVGWGEVKDALDDYKADLREYGRPLPYPRGAS